MWHLFPPACSPSSCGPGSSRVGRGGVWVSGQKLIERPSNMVSSSSGTATVEVDNGRRLEHIDVSLPLHRRPYSDRPPQDWTHAHHKTRCVLTTNSIEVIGLRPYPRAAAAQMLTATSASRLIGGMKLWRGYGWEIPRFHWSTDYEPPNCVGHGQMKHHNSPVTKH
jgi:hypothetical protein